MAKDLQVAIAYSHFADALERLDAGPNVVKVVRQTAGRIAREALLKDLFARKEG